ncbi:plant-specific domain TIGR01615 family protein [Musa troglodytarum]|uniref:Plant-specific domain TIGR01615 family protein n=1 Tax=Musa troglodytarum TaxID=320322 RepID=A0A9E7H478_9LILI|nr:plant-specific domain TIGR01615 family protein [Musa troglodytarum]
MLKKRNLRRPPSHLLKERGVCKKRRLITKLVLSWITRRRPQWFPKGEHTQDDGASRKGIFTLLHIYIYSHN